MLLSSFIRQRRCQKAVSSALQRTYSDNVEAIFDMLVAGPIFEACGLTLIEPCAVNLWEEIVLEGLLLECA